MLELERLRRLADIERRGVFQRDGYLSAASWLVDRFRIAWGSAKASMRLARAFEHVPATRRALEAGDVSLSAATMLVEAREAEPDTFAAAEDQLVEAARIHPVRELRRVVAFWRQRVERERDPSGQGSQHAARRLHASVMFQGMVRVDGDLAPEAGEALLTALRAVMDADVRASHDDEVRTMPQRRADAHEICRTWLDVSDRASASGERPHITVTVPIEALTDPDSGVAELDHVGPAHATTAHRLGATLR